MANTRIYEVRIKDRSGCIDYAVFTDLRVGEVSLLEAVLNTMGYHVSKRTAGKNGKKVIVFEKDE